MAPAIWLLLHPAELVSQNPGKTIWRHTRHLFHIDDFWASAAAVCHDSDNL
jgi:hypothetical protein